MTDHRKNQIQRTTIFCIALPALIWFPFGFGMIVVSGDQLLFGFDDFPLGMMILGFGLGLVLALAALVWISRSLWRGSARLPVIFTIAIVAFDFLSVPASRLMTRMEENRRNNRPAFALLDSSATTASFWHPFTVRPNCLSGIRYLESAIRPSS